MNVATNPPGDERAFRAELIREEYAEAWDALDFGEDIPSVVSELADILYVVYGTALHYGVDLDAVVAEVHRANMSKLGDDGKPLRRADGKVLKGPNYRPPDVAGVLGLRPWVDLHCGYNPSNCPYGDSCADCKPRGEGA